MFVVQGIERRGYVSLEFFFNKKENIMDNVIEMANFSSVEKVVVREIIVDEEDNDISETIMVTEAYFFKR